MSRKRLMLTGASGFVGGYMGKLLGEDHSDHIELIPFIDPENGQEPDIADAASIFRCLEEAKPDIVIHLAAISAPRHAREDLARAWEVNHTGSLNLARAILTFAPDCRLVWAGSSESYGLSFNRFKNPINEEAPLDPATIYGATKAASDLMLRQMALDGLNVVIFRPFNHTGPGQTSSFVVPAFASQVARIEAGLQPPILEVGNLDAYRDFLDVRDVIDGYVKAALSDSVAPGSRYNLSSAQPVQIKTILDCLTAACEQSITIKISKERYIENLVPTASGDWTAAERDLGWHPKRHIEETFLSVLQEHRQFLKEGTRNQEFRK